MSFPAVSFQTKKVAWEAQTVTHIIFPECGQQFASPSNVNKGSRHILLVYRLKNKVYSMMSC